MSFDDLVAATAREALRVFGEPVTYTPEVGPAVPVTGIFSAQYVLAKGSAEAGVESTVPAVFVLLADLPTDPEEDEPTLTIGGVTYRVRERQPDGAGGIVLGLVPTS